MENNTKIGIGVLALAGVGYYFYNKSKSSMTNVTTTNVGQPNKTGFDREKASKELASLIFSKRKKPIDIELTKQASLQALQEAERLKGLVTGVGMALSKDTIKPTREQVLSQSLSNYRANLQPPITELTLYKRILGGLNGISDDSDAEFIFNYFKKLVQAGDDRNFKPDLDTQIRIDKIQNKYPDALKQFDLG